MTDTLLDTAMLRRIGSDPDIVPLLTDVRSERLRYIADLHQWADGADA